jgi:dynein intermediate chain 1
MAPKKKATTAPKKAAKKEETAPIVQQEEDDFYREPIKRIVRPDDQLNLTEEQLDEEFTRVLTANDPNVPNNITKYNYKYKAYKQDPEGPMDHLAFHYHVDGSCLHKESEDAILQQQKEDEKKMEIERSKKEAAQEALDAGEEDIEAEVPHTGKNQFNYSERACQTFNNPVRERGVATVPPELVSFSANVSQWEIYDKYMKAWGNASALREEGAAADGSASVAPPLPVAAHSAADDEDVVHSAAMGTALRLLERMEIGRAHV